jgi:hypothetical protein
MPYRNQRRHRSTHERRARRPERGDTDKPEPVQGTSMKARAEYRDREETEVAVLDALVDRNEEGMTVLEVRARVDADIDDIETALGALKDDGLISATTEESRTIIHVEESVVPDGDPGQDRTTGDQVAMLARKLKRALRRLLFP